MRILLTILQMSQEWDIPQSVISKVTKNMTPVDYIRNCGARRGLYSASEVAAELAGDTENKLQRAEESVINYKDRLRRLRPYFEENEGGTSK